MEQLKKKLLILLILVALNLVFSVVVLNTTNQSISTRVYLCKAEHEKQCPPTKLGYVSCLPAPCTNPIHTANTIILLVKMALVTFALLLLVQYLKKHPDKQKIIFTFFVVIIFFNLLIDLDIRNSVLNCSKDICVPWIFKMLVSIN